MPVNSIAVDLVPLVQQELDLPVSQHNHEKIQQLIQHGAFSQYVLAEWLDLLGQAEKLASSEQVYQWALCSPPGYTPLTTRIQAWQ